MRLLNCSLVCKIDAKANDCLLTFKLLSMFIKNKLFKRFKRYKLKKDFVMILQKWKYLKYMYSYGVVNAHIAGEMIKTQSIYFFSC